MADSHNMQQAQNMQAARETYEGFIRLIKVATPAIAVVTALVIYLLTH